MHAMSGNMSREGMTKEVEEEYKDRVDEFAENLREKWGKDFLIEY